LPKKLQGVVCKQGLIVIQFAIVTFERKNMAEQQPSRIKNLTIVGITALAGLVTVVVIMTALILGLWVDAQIGTRGPATICFLVASVPVSLYLMFRMVLGLVKHIPPPTPRE
jgi:hypothetical protein